MKTFLLATLLTTVSLAQSNSTSNTQLSTPNVIVSSVSYDTGHTSTQCATMVSIRPSVPTVEAYKVTAQYLPPGASAPVTLVQLAVRTDEWTHVIFQQRGIMAETITVTELVAGVVSAFQ